MTVPVSHSREQLDALNEKAGASLEDDPSHAAELASEAAVACRIAHHLPGLARALFLAGSAQRRLASFKDAQERLLEASHLQAELGDETGELDALLELNRTYRALGESARAGECLNRALALSRALGRRDAEANALNGLAAVAHTLGSHEHAVEHLERSLAIRREIGDVSGQVECLNNLGIVKTVKGDYPDALSTLLECHELLRSQGSPEAEANCLVNIGNVYQDMGQHEAALSHYQRAYGIAHAAGLRRLELIALSNLAETRLLDGDHREAIRLFEEVLVYSRQTGYRETEIDALEGLARANIKRGRPGEAVEAIKQALAISRACGERNREVRLLVDLSETRAAGGELSEAIALLTEATEIAASSQSRKLQRECEERLAAAFEQAGDVARALAHYKSAHLIERELFSEEGERRLQGLATQYELEQARRDADAYRERTEEARRANETLEAKVRERTEELENAQIETVMRLALAAEYRDDNTGQHTHRVGLLSAQLASAVGLDDEQVDLIKVAARLHDVGKIGISDQILLKAGKLDADEYNRMKAHTTIGAQILSGGRSPILRLAEEIALNHHERWDGNGYPRGLSAEDIPLVGRIVAVADVYDALVSERPYKRAWTQEEAIVEVERQSGLMFDPRLANALRGVLANESGRLNDDKGAPTESPATPPAPVRSPRQPDTHREQAIYASLDATLEKAWAERTSDLSACRQATERALAVAVAHAYRRGVGLARRNLGYCHYLASEYERAIDELLDGLDIGRELGDHVLTRDCLNWLGAVHTSLGDYGAAIEYVERTLELSRNALDEAGVASCITNLGLLHHYLGHDEEAVRYHEESVAISRQAGEVHRQAAALNNLGITLTALGRHGEAVSTFEQALPLAEGTGDRDLRARLLVNLGEAQAAAGDPGLALTTNESALELIRACGNREVEGHALLNTGVIRLSAGDGKGALDPLERALAYATTSGYRTLAYQAHQHLASALRMSGDLDGAFAHLERYHALEREVRDEEADRRLRAFSTQREIERARSEAEIHRLRNVELARALASLQEADRLKDELLKELRAKSSELERQFTVDPLTGVLNRAFFQARLLVEVERARENRQPIAAAIIDIDNLKGINDGYSHTVGDNVLLEVAAIIRANCRDSDVVARYGGSQFVVALPGTSDSRAVTVCERIRSAIERHDWQRLHPALSVTASVGLAEGPLDGDHERLLNSADARLASAKQQGPNRLAC